MWNKIGSEKNEIIRESHEWAMMNLYAGKSSFKLQLN